MASSAGKRRKLDKATKMPMPKVLFGTSSLGNLFSEPTHAEKKAVVEKILAANPAGAVFDLSLIHI